MKRFVQPLLIGLVPAVLVFAIMRDMRPRADGAAKKLADRLDSVQADRDRLIAAAAARKTAESTDTQRQLIEVAEGAVLPQLDQSARPMFLQGTLAVHKRPKTWVVEGIALEGYTFNTTAHFFAVEIETADFPARYRPKGMVIDLTKWYQHYKGDLVREKEPLPNVGVYPRVPIQ